MSFGNAAKLLNITTSSVLMQPKTVMKYLRLVMVSSTRLIFLVKLPKIRIPVHS